MNTPKNNSKSDGKVRSKAQKQRLSNSAFQYVVDNIRAGKFEEGQKITERSVAQKLKISHVPVREAMEKLEQLGWIERFPNRGAFVKKFNVEHIEKLYQIREVLEVGAVSIFAKSITKEQLSQLKDVVEMFDDAWKAKDVILYQQIDAKFHRMLVGFLDNEILSNLFETLILQSRGFFLGAAVQAAFSWEENVEDLEFASHKHIFEALASGKYKIAEKLVREHALAGCKVAIMVNKTKNVMCS